MIPDGVGPDAVGCSQAAPFLAYIDTIVLGNPSTQTVRYCSAGLAGPLDASIRSNDAAVYAETLGAPLDSGVVGVYIGGGGCTGCFVRLIANGVTADGPFEDFSGD